MTGLTPTPDGADAPGASGWHVGVQVGSDWSARCFTYPDERPILVLNTSQVGLSLSVLGGVVTANHINFAHSLVQAANEYLIECERLLMDRQADDTSGGAAVAA
ncbi:hypothetical protein FDG2_0616 [Candidatus Protofrankia californiensis]|uniref:Uncharacterized protein n=1 Tax=Candidatus Protofrankia californiensis TaxID=1839754 RepID=A0A1C3NU02_9ACTN|nr:hypothetical protein FDG2_0616 [Candidatus Protofrankia californiensis]